jgi:hypothetical protein
MTKANNFIKNACGSNPGKIRGGYKLDGTVINSYADRTFVPAFIFCAEAAGDMQWRDRLISYLTGYNIDSDTYFANSIKLLTLIDIESIQHVSEINISLIIRQELKKYLTQWAEKL